ncbi:Alpha/Beta hydrolase protein [Suillus clintonianus]|uniref:Alpha/Beta hydrolase protein n=1 Tax=Suillus clintonianus TaxID=1904413 RepID=UPI001B8699C2|nr:Alpha/Beta hydrolase protein [Suillus clintonianus]KAG2122471.1 Alpha/Beta hydrolase protein [Suillus clintonianus]
MEQYLPLRDGRTLAYAEDGNISSKTVVLHFHGLFTVGGALLKSPVLLSKNIHLIMPTLPGWGNTSPPPPSTPYNDCIASDMTTLLSHLYPDSNDRGIKLYISGSSFGSVPAQILYGAPYDKFPFGRCISGVLLTGALTPFRYHKDYAKQMTWESYFMFGPIGYYVPFNLVSHVMKFMLARKMATIEGAGARLRETFFNRMDQAEQEMFARWSEKHGTVPENVVRRMGEGCVKSVSKSWEGFMLTLPLLHSDWGFRPDALDEEHSRPRVLLTAGKDDHMTPVTYAHYLAANYKNARIKDIGGGHMSMLYKNDELLDWLRSSPALPRRADIRRLE